MLLFFVRTMVRKKLFIEQNSFFVADYVKIIELHNTHGVTGNLIR